MGGRLVGRRTRRSHPFHLDNSFISVLVGCKECVKVTSRLSRFGDVVQHSEQDGNLSLLSQDTDCTGHPEQRPNPIPSTLTHQLRASCQFMSSRACICSVFPNLVIVKIIPAFHVCPKTRQSSVKQLWRPRQNNKRWFTAAVLLLPETNVHLDQSSEATRQRANEARQLMQECVCLGS